MQPEQSPRFYGVLEQPVSDVATKVYMDETNHFFWNHGDLLSIFYGKTYNRQFSFMGDSGETAGEFERSDEDPSHATEQVIETHFDYAIFPWNKNNSCDTQGNLQVVIPSEQEYYDDSFGVGLRPLMVARAPEDDGMFYFKHVGSYIDIKMKGDNISVKSISFQGNNSETMAGKLKVSFDTDGLPIVNGFNSTSALVPLSSTISMTFDTPIVLNEDTEKVVWLVVPSGTFSGYTLTITDQDGGTFQKVRSNSLTLERAKFYDLAATVTITPAAVPVTDVTVSPTTLELTVDEESTLTATVSPENATNKNVSWASGDENVATVDEDGVVTAIAAGEADITVTTEDGEFTATCKVIVQNKVVPVESVSLDKETLDIYVGDDPVALTATVTPTNATNKKVTWASENSNVATVDANGVVTAIAAGEADITVTTEDGEFTATCTVTVKVHVASVTLDQTTLELSVDGDPVTLIATVNPENATNKNVSWESSDDDVATVDANGKVSAVAAGTATITVTTEDGGYTATCEVTVPDVVTYTLEIDPAEDAEVNVGSEFTFKLWLTTTTNGDAGEPENVAADATWTIDEDSTDIATIVTAGTFKGLKEGTANITVKYTKGEFEKTLTATLKVNKDPNHAGDPVPIEDDNC